MIIVCTVKHPKKTDVMVMMTPSLAPNWNDSVGVYNNNLYSITIIILS